MKNRYLSAALLAGILAAAPLSYVRADESDAPPMQGSDSGPDHGKAPHWDLAKMQKRLGLSDDQVTKLKAIMDAEKTAMKPLWDKQKDSMKKLHEQVEAKASDDEIKATLADLKAGRKAMMDQREQFQSQKADLLTSTQQAKMLLGAMKRMHPKGGMKDKDHDHMDKQPS
jgi:Spy/CpxP family protein refolding chaperone